VIRILATHKYDSTYSADNIYSYSYICSYCRDIQVTSVKIQIQIQFNSILLLAQTHQQDMVIIAQLLDTIT
jgi:hypothetical protein